MSTILYARVKQKKATEAVWLVNPLILLDGEVAYVVDPTDPAVVTNYKIGVGDKTFAELPYVIHYSVDATYQAVKRFIGVNTNQTITGIFSSGTALRNIYFLNTAALSLTIRVGTTAGGAELGEFAFSTTSRVLDINYLFESSKTVYITGITGLCTFFVEYVPFSSSPAIPPSGGTVVFKYPKGHFGYFYNLYDGHLEENFNTSTGAGVSGTSFENCALTGTNDLVDYTNAYIAGISPGGTPQALTGNTANTVLLTVAQLPAHNHNTERPRTDIVGVRYEANHMKAGSDRGLYTGDTITSTNTGGGQTVDIRPRTIKMYSFVAISD